jgi:antitoxin component of MazEF toxin-antitoxin module
MTFTTIQNSIKIGTSTGVTLPAKEFKRMGLKVGDPVKITFEPAVNKQITLAEEYA